MTRKILLAATCAALLATHAHAQLAQEATQRFGWMTQLARMGQQIQQATQRYQQLLQTYRAFTGVRNLGSAVSALGMAGIQNPLPINPYAVQGLVSGQGGITGIGGQLGSLYTGSLYNNRVYTPSGADFQAQQMRQNAQGLAGVQALAQQSYQAAAARLQELHALQARAAVASDPKEVADLQLAVERVQAEAASQQQQLQTIELQTRVQEQVMRQRQAEADRQGIDQLISYYGQNAN